MLPLIEREFVDHLGWVDEDEILEIFALVQSVPGVIAINSSIFLGYRVAGLWGAVSACLGMVLPSFLIISLIAALYQRFQHIGYVQRAFSGVRAGVTALIALSAFRLGRRSISSPFPLGIALAALAALLFFDLHAAFIIIAAALAGLFRYRVFSRRGGDQ